jgi:hypothetical protein
MSSKAIVGTLGGWRSRLSFASRACGDGLVITPVLSPAAPTAAFLDAAHVQLTAAAAFVIAAAALGAASGAFVAVEAATAA